MICSLLYLAYSLSARWRIKARYKFGTPRLSGPGCLTLISLLYRTAVPPAHISTTTQQDKIVPCRAVRGETLVVKRVVLLASCHLEKLPPPCERIVCRFTFPNPPSSSLLAEERAGGGINIVFPVRPRRFGKIMPVLVRHAEAIRGALYSEVGVRGADSIPSPSLHKGTTRSQA